MNKPAFRRVFKVFLLFLAFALLVTTTQATDSSASDIPLDDPLVECVPALYQIDAILSEEVQANRAKAQPEQFDIVSYDIGNAYRVIPMQNMPLTLYNQTGTFDAVLTDEVQWRVPVTCAGNEPGLYCLKETENGVEFYDTSFGVGVSIFSPSDPMLDQIIDDSDLITSPVISVQFVHSYMYYTLFVRVFTEDGDYLIPFSLLEDDLGIHNGTVYTVPTLMGILTEHIDEQYLYDHPDKMGTFLPLRAQIAKKSLGKSAAYAVPVLLIAGGVVWFILSRRRRRKAR